MKLSDFFMDVYLSIFQETLFDCRHTQPFRWHAKHREPNAQTVKNESYERNIFSRQAEGFCGYGLLNLAGPKKHQRMAHGGL